MSNRRRLSGTLVRESAPAVRTVASPTYTVDRARLTVDRAKLAETVAQAVAEVSDTPWSQFTQADYDIGQWHRACLVHLHDGQPTSKSQCRLPVREPGGAVNRNAVHAAAGRIGQVDAPSEKKRGAARKLMGLYRNQLHEDPPESLRSLAGAEAVEPVPQPQRLSVSETPLIVEAPKAGKPGRLLVQLITAGWSKNRRYYPAEVLERDGARAFPAGTLNFIDHDTDTESMERPAGSLARLASVQASPAYWDPNRKALLAEVRLFAPWREAITDMADHIGMSIRAWVCGEDGQAEGQRGFVVSEIAEGQSVDYVTVPAAGGAILSVLESVSQHAAEARNIGGWLESRLHLALTQLGDDMYGDGRLTRDERITLSNAIGDALSAYTTRVEADAPQLYERDLYDEPAMAEPMAAESTPPLEAATTDVTGGAPPTAPTPNTTEESMGTETGQSPGEAGTATATEAQTAPQTESANEARAALLESERNSLRDRATSMSEALAEAQTAARAAQAQAAEAVNEMRRLRANEAGRTTVDRMIVAPESGVDDRFQALIAPRVHAAVLNHVPLTDTGDVDQAALEALVTAAIRTERVHAAQLAEAAGVGQVTGLGAEGDPQMQMTESDLQKGLADIFGGLPGMSTEAAQLAAKGR